MAASLFTQIPPNFDSSKLQTATGFVAGTAVSPTTDKNGPVLICTLNDPTRQNEMLIGLVVPFTKKEFLQQVIDRLTALRDEFYP